ncbi:MAG: iron ABC transporter permease [Nitrososphaerota archaeon]|jgi:iron complex transport system permease protein|nr:iron ABC transporter permease [Nitrososphaerota archaeon]
MVENKQIIFKSNQELMVESEKKKYRKVIVKRVFFIIASVVMMFVLVGVALAFGSADITFLEAYSAVFARAFPNLFHTSPLADTVVWTLRLPRILLTIFAGAVLAMSGCTSQTVLRNPIATPYTLGVSAGAGLGAALGIILGTGLGNGDFVVIGNAFVFSLIPLVVILLLVKRRGASPETMILAGIAMVYIFNACTTILQYFAEANAVSATVFWLVGDLSRAAWYQLPYVLVAFVVGFGVNLWLAWDITAMQLGDDTAKSLGVEADRTRRVSLVVACLSTAVVVAFTGAIGFVCLVAPHICRAFVGQNQRVLIISSALVGSILLLVADIVARRFMAPVVLPVGAITAFLGGPLLLYLLIKRKSNR